MRRLTRNLGSVEPMPKASNSDVTEPQPMPSSKRPSDAWSSVAASRASTAGCRKESHSTREPTRSVRVWAAIYVFTVMASNIGDDSAPGGAR